MVEWASLLVVPIQDKAEKHNSFYTNWARSTGDGEDDSHSIYSVEPLVLMRIQVHISSFFSSYFVTIKNNRT